MKKKYPRDTNQDTLLPRLRISELRNPSWPLNFTPCLVSAVGPVLMIVSFGFLAYKMEFEDAFFFFSLSHFTISEIRMPL